MLYSVPVGVRFYPTEDELVSFYLRKKLEGARQDIHTVIPVVNIYAYNPWDLPQLAGEHSREDVAEQWFFFIPRQDREARGGRPTRLTTEGYWKATGSPGFAYSDNNRIVGAKRTMVFYIGRAPSGKKTDWKMNEYRAIEGRASAQINNNIANVKLHQEFSVCRVYKNTKCVRAFDRRPTDPVVRATAAPVFQPPPTEVAGSNDASAVPPMATEAAFDNHLQGSSSFQDGGSSSGGDHDDISWSDLPSFLSRWDDPDDLYCLINGSA